VIWAVCDGALNIEQITNIIATLDELDIEDGLDDIVNNTVERLSEQGFLHLTKHEPLDYPIDITSYTHFVSTRGGLYAITPEKFQRLAYGMFFGMCLDRDNNLLVFDYPHLSSSLWRIPFRQAKKAETNEGVIHRLTVKGGYIDAPSRLIEGVANNCHYLIRDNDDFYAVDTERQAIIKIDADKNKQWIRVFEETEYHHINALGISNGSWLVMKPKRSSAEINSGFGVFNGQWQLIDEIDLPAQMAHDFLFTGTNHEGNLEFWYCDSNNNRIKHYPSHDAIMVKPCVEHNNTTRGLADTDDCWVVGSGRYGTYYRFAPNSKYLGAVSYIDKHSRQLAAQVPIPEAPCCIVGNPWFARSV